MLKKTLIMLGVCFCTQYSIQAMQLPDAAENAKQKFASQRQYGNILFYDKDKIFNEFSNLCYSPFKTSHLDSNGVLEPVSWKWNEQYFQAMKFNVPGSKHNIDIIKAVQEPYKVFEAGRAAGMRSDWELVVNKPFRGSLKKDAIMYDGLVFKFQQNPQLAALLLATDGWYLIEDTRNAKQPDSYWGWGADTLGKNMLGLILMQVREDLKNGVIKVDCSKTGVPVSKVTMDELDKMVDFNTVYAQLCSGQAPVVAAPQGYQYIVFDNNYTPSRAVGLMTRLAESIKLRYGLKNGPHIHISAPKDLLFKVDSPQIAQEIVDNLRDFFGIEGVNVFFGDSSTVYIPKNQISKTLAEVLELDGGFITLFQNQNGI